MKTLLIVCLSVLGVLAGGANAEELTLRILAWGPYTPPEDLLEFKALVKEKYAVQLNFRVREVADEEEFFNAARSQDEKTQADLISPSKSVLMHYKWNMIDNQLVLPIRLENVPNFQQLYHYFRELTDIKKDGAQYGVPYAWGPYGIVYNTALFKTPPASWAIFWDPQYANRYGINGTSPGGENVVIAALVSGVKREDVFTLDKVSTPAVIKKLQQLSDNSKVQWPGAEQGKFYQGLAFGASWGGGLNEIKALGETWKLTVPEEGASGWIDCWAITHHVQNQPKLRRIAEEFINFFISDEKQATVAVRKMTNYPTNWNSRRYLTAEEILDHRIDQPEFLNRLVFLRALPKRDYNGLKFMWREANAKNVHKILESKPDLSP